MESRQPNLPRKELKRPYEQGQGSQLDRPDPTIGRTMPEPKTYDDADTEVSNDWAADPEDVIAKSSDHLIEQLQFSTQVLDQVSKAISDDVDRLLNREHRKAGDPELQQLTRDKFEVAIAKELIVGIAGEGTEDIDDLYHSETFWNNIQRILDKYSVTV